MKHLFCFERQNCRIISFLLSFLLAILLLSCHKDENSSPSNDAFRITGYKIYTDEVLTGKVEIDYSGERITEMRQFENTNDDTTFYEAYRVLIEYPVGNKAVSQNYTYENQKWALLSKQEIYFHGEDVDSCLGYTYANGNWELATIYSRKYNGEKISKNILYNYYSNWRPYLEEEFKYDGDKLSYIINSGYHGTNDWQQVGKYSFNYSGTKIKDIVTSVYENSTWIDMVKTEFEYTGNKVAQIKEFVFSEGSWSPGFSTYLYTYDIDGNLASWSIVSSNSSLKLVYTYEKAKGNRSTMIQTDGSNWIFFNIFPNPSKGVLLPQGRSFRPINGHGFLSLEK